MKKQSGFTLVEIAIVMVIIGLLLGGVMKGQELMVNAKVKNLAADFNIIPAAYYSYIDRFRAIPGDDAAANTHVAGTNATTGGTVGNGIIEGTWDSATNTDESFLVFQHLRLANLMNGTTVVTNPATYYQINAAGGRVGMSGAGPITNQVTLVICSTTLDGGMARRLDTSMDDGVGNTGAMFAATVATPATAVANPAAGTNYTACMKL